MNERVAVIGLGYVGLPVALAAARVFAQTVGFDTKCARVEALRAGHDETGEAEGLAETALTITDDPKALAGCTFFIVAVPTPIDRDNRPDLRALLAASATVGAVLQKGGCVVFESTGYPGLTEEICGPAIAAASGLVAGRDFHLGYSPERINPGDRMHRLENIVKVVSGDSPTTLDRVARVYEAFVTAGVHRAASIAVAEAAKVLENTQRDLNIALMNELAIICERLGLRTHDVLATAATKWNFMPFQPGLVGGHCIGVDPYYLTAKAEQVGISPQVILAGRRINNDMGRFVAHKCMKLLARSGAPINGARVGVLGLTFKENVSDLRNSRVPDIIAELSAFGCDALVHDPIANAEHAHREYGLTLLPFAELRDLDALILAVPHAFYLQAPLLQCIRPSGVIVDIKSVLKPPPHLAYWSL